MVYLQIFRTNSKMFLVKYTRTKIYIFLFFMNTTWSLRDIISLK